MILNLAAKELNERTKYNVQRREKIARQLKMKDLKHRGRYLCQRWMLRGLSKLFFPFFRKLWMLAGKYL